MKEANLYIGIDPSINSTGVCAKSDICGKCRLYNIKSKRTLKEEKLYKEAAAPDNAPVVIMYQYSNPNIYNKKDKNRDQHAFELVKTKNAINITKEIYNIIYKEANSISTGDNRVTVRVCLEAPAYGAGARTVSLADLCGLNYLIREMVLSLPENCNNIKDAELVCSVPSEIKKYATGRGDADKDIMLYCFSLLEPGIAETYSFMKTDDMADAYFMCMYAEYIYNKEYDKKSKNTNMYSAAHEKLISDKINSMKVLKKLEKDDIYKSKRNKSIWDDGMRSFAEALTQQ